MKSNQKGRARNLRPLRRVLAIIVLTLAITSIVFVQPFAKDTPPTVTITELAGSITLHPSGLVEVDRGNLTMTLVDSNGKDVMVANYAPEIVGPYVEYIMGTDVKVLVVGDPNSSTPWELITMLSLLAAFSSLGVVFAFGYRKSPKAPDETD